MAKDSSVIEDTVRLGDLRRIDPIRGVPMLQRKLERFLQEQRPVWIYLRDQQCWIEDALVVEILGDLITVRHEDDDEDECSSWELSVRLESIGAVSTRLASVSRSASGDDLATTGDCPEAERLSSP
jgi:hypothetical protein